jgi:uncharacterized protein YvpB
MKIIKNYQHKVASHCESGTIRNLLKFAGLEVSEPLIFGIGTGIVFAYLTNAKGVSGFPITAIRLPMGTILKNTKKLLGIDFYIKKFKSTEQAIDKLNSLLDSGQPAAACVDMFYMKYLPDFMHVHAPFHFITLIGRDENDYAISDPYYPGIGKLSKEYLKLSWETHALFAKDNLLAYVESVPKNIDWKKAIKISLKATCRNMVLPPVMSTILPIFGVTGIKLFAKKILSWPDKYKGLALREGMLFTPTILEEQGTGGGAFRMLYAAFLKESADIFNSENLRELAVKMAEIGEKWRDASRELIKIAKKIPLKNSDYPDWFAKNEKVFRESLSHTSNLFIGIADNEKELFVQLKKIIKELV